MTNPFSIGESINKDVKASTPRIKHLKQKGLQQSIYEGSASSFSAGIANTYIIPFALALKATAFQVGLLSSFSSLARPLAQLLGSKLMETKSRKKIVIQFVFLQALTCLPIAALSFLLWKDILPTTLPYLLVILFSLYVAFEGIAFPSWFSWMGDLVPEKKRGKYFSIRNRTTGAFSLTAILMGAFILDAYQTRGLALLGFSTLFVIASTFRFISFLMFKKQFTPNFKLNKGYYFSFPNFIKTFDNYGKFAAYQAYFNFALMIASPFFAVYMLNVLNFSYITFMAVTVSYSAFYLMFLPLAGRFSDRYGNKKLLFLSNILFASFPIFWLFLKNPIALILIPELIGGLAFALHNIAFTNFTYDSVSSQRRGICISYTNILIGAGMFFGSLLGGFLIKYINSELINVFFIVFIVSAILRLSAALLFLPHIKDERKVARLPLMHIDLSNPFRILRAEVGWFYKFLK